MLSLRVELRIATLLV
ncbi:hypothetical protein BOH78_1450 [Pichia kudriavzevii]|nr:hypothetical protein BOH78_5429 [Pichia kudriavzevii]ONH70518.1 hypothetical protein BOH78_5163 [Pichia kudriavzevii]ONH70774.1 hypothetical protein BOH78_4983 [Pichia kudriavzevii]ONH72813.1 hypothetical protein BOH78_3585 [Pichia kudriavzevii]ONH75929.1 hypothetical protein BOH78_1450 [Pichia kudriavzevii]